jgi:hypothetical protein
MTYELMEAAWRSSARTVAMPESREPVGRTIGAAKKYVMSTTRDRVDPTAELVRGILGSPFNGSVGAGHGTGHGRRDAPTGVGGGGVDRCVRVRGPSQPGPPRPTLFARLSERVELKLVERPVRLGRGDCAV